LAIDAVLELAEWETLGASLAEAQDAIAWAIGDWLLYGLEHFDGVIDRAVRATRKSRVTLMEYVRVARSLPQPRRNRKLSFTHHQLVARFPAAEQDKLLAFCEVNEWSTTELRSQLPAPALLTSRSKRRSAAPLVDRVRDAGQTVLRAAEPLDEAYARVPLAVLERLADALSPDVSAKCGDATQAALSAATCDERSVREVDREPLVQEKLFESRPGGPIWA
jgi:hypothetical protein